MGNKFYMLSFDYPAKKYWYLRTIVPKTEDEAREWYFDFWDLEVCQPLKYTKEIKLESYIKGEKAPFNLFETLIPLISKDIMEPLKPYFEKSEYIPVVVDGVKDEYYLVNILNEVDCIDRKNSTVKIVKDPKDETGQRKMVVGGRASFKFDTEKEYPDIFRVKYGYQIIGVSQKMKEVFESINLKELVYTPFYITNK